MQEIIKRLIEEYPNATYELDWADPYQLLMATILAAQCTDERVNKVTPALFTAYPDADAMVSANRLDLEGIIKSTGFYQKKAERLQLVSAALMHDFRGKVPATMDGLTSLPGIGRKTANVVLNVAFRVASGIIIDTHGHRVAPRMGLTTATTPEKIEADLMTRVPKSQWLGLGLALVLHGRRVCTSANPACDTCVIHDICPRNGVSQPVSAIMSKSKPKPTTIKTPALFDDVETPPVDATSTTPLPTPSASDDPQHLPADWAALLGGELTAPYFEKLSEFVATERATHEVFPPAEDVFNAFRFTPVESLRVLLLGQDPYHDNGQAHGLCFSVLPGVAVPPSLKNIYKELQADVGVTPPKHGNLEAWAKRGVLLLNAVLTVRAHEANSHKDRGWERFTDAVIKAISARSQPTIFVLWGGYAQKKIPLIDTTKHRIIQSAHPSPLSVKKFLGSKPFSQINDQLTSWGVEPIDWTLPTA